MALQEFARPQLGGEKVEALDTLAGDGLVMGDKGLAKAFPFE
jgi:hypothetical protein